MQNNTTSPHPREKPLEVQEQILQQSRDGASLQALADRFGCSVNQLRKWVRQERYAEILQWPLDYMPNPADFEAPDAEQEILGPLPPANRSSRTIRAPKGLPSYLASLYEVPLLTAEQERHLFRQYNYLKYRASQLRDALDPQRPNLRALDQIEDFYQRAVHTKNQIVRANLRLVVSIAKKYSTDHEDVFDLASDGNMSLMRAAEKFNYALGNRFSTYATWAITRNFARAYQNRISQASRFRNSQEEMEDLADDRCNPYIEETAQQLREVSVSKILNCLSARERDIVAKRFGLARHQPPRTLKEIGEELGVSKERVRQIEKVALSKLREAAAQARLEYTAA
jgi:RNA polymerase primary sigma factor